MPIFCGVFCIIPAAIGVTFAVQRAYKDEKLPRWVFALILVVVWSPILLASASELWWMTVEEPRRLAAGEPLE
ncbi:MAG: hypothetical protein JSS66_08410 [Armatimonadetes bacterium]|nr:hypothetical protein [Armatimonadota bacterium]